MLLFALKLGSDISRALLVEHTRRCWRARNRKVGRLRGGHAIRRSDDMIEELVMDRGLAIEGTDGQSVAIRRRVSHVGFFRRMAKSSGCFGREDLGLVRVSRAI